MQHVPISSSLRTVSVWGLASISAPSPCLRWGWCCRHKLDPTRGDCRGNRGWPSWPGWACTRSDKRSFDAGARANRQEEQLGQAIRMLDDRYKLYAFLSSSLPDYILVSPAGVHVLIVRTDAGQIACVRDQWNKGSGSRGHVVFRANAR